MVKATNHEVVVPKEKHVAHLIGWSLSRSVSDGDIIKHLTTRIHSNESIVVLKALIVTHRLLLEAGLSLIRQMGQNTAMFNLSKSTDVSTASAFTISQFSRKYVVFIEEKIHCYKTLAVAYERNAIESMANIESLKGLQLLLHLESLNSVLERAEAIDFKEAYESNIAPLRYAVSFTIKVLSHYLFFFFISSSSTYSHDNNNYNNN